MTNFERKIEKIESTLKECKNKNVESENEVNNLRLKYRKSEEVESQLRNELEELKNFNSKNSSLC